MASNIARQSRSLPAQGLVPTACLQKCSDPLGTSSLPCFLGLGNHSDFVSRGLMTLGTSYEWDSASVTGAVSLRLGDVRTCVGTGILYFTGKSILHYTPTPRFVDLSSQY